jgi:CheY-like chemotaxis protein
VDDNLTNQKMLMFQLRRLGITPDITANGLEALQAIARKVYSLVFPDIQMPVMDGFEALRKIRSQPHLKELPVVMVSATEDAFAEEKSMAAGATAFFRKPLNTETMKRIVQQWCGVESQRKAS